MTDQCEDPRDTELRDAVMKGLIAGFIYLAIFVATYWLVFDTNFIKVGGVVKALIWYGLNALMLLIVSLIYSRFIPKTPDNVEEDVG